MTSVVCSLLVRREDQTCFVSLSGVKLGGHFLQRPVLEGTASVLLDHASVCSQSQIPERLSFSQHRLPGQAQPQLLASPLQGPREVLGDVRHVAPPWGLWCRLWGNNWLSGSGCGLCCLPELDLLRSRLLKCPLVETWISSTVRSSSVATET